MRATARRGSFRARALVGAGVVAAGLGTMSWAWACTETVGSTRTSASTVARGSQVGATASFTRPNAGGFVLYYNDPFSSTVCHHSPTIINNTAATSNGFGDVPNRIGTIPASSNTGTGQLCFFNGFTVTAPANITVT